MKTVLNILEHIDRIDDNKEPEVILPHNSQLGYKLGSSGDVDSFVRAVPYYIRKVYYYGDEPTILSELQKQFKVDAGVFVRPSIEIAIIITSTCNLACNNCNMLSNHPHTTSTMTMDILMDFVVNYLDGLRGER